MDILVLNNYYSEKGFTEKETALAVQALSDFQQWISGCRSSLEECSVDEMKKYIGHLSDRSELNGEILLALARSAYLAANREVYIYFTQIIERDSIIANLRTHMDSVLGSEKTCRIFNSINVPESGAPPETAVGFTQKLMENLEKELSAEERRKALTANAHGIPSEAFAREAALFRESESLERYLSDFHRRSVETLQKHSDSGKVWFEQIITQPVVDLVKENREILGGVLDRGKILWTKIPYDAQAWLLEKDRDKRRYYACHCPMAREVLNIQGERIPRDWCNCTSGYIQQRFNAIFGEKVQVDLLETVLDGDDRCRFAIHVPQKFL